MPNHIEDCACGQQHANFTEAAECYRRRRQCDDERPLIDDMAAVLREAVTAEERSGGLPPWLPKARAALAALDGLEPRTALSQGVMPL